MQTSPKKVYIESYGCAMNFSDSEIVASIMQDKGYAISTDQYDADIIFLNTCSVRDNAEKTIRNRLIHLKSNKKKNRNLMVGILGCMAERLKEQLLEEEQLVDIVAGPDTYRTLPDLIEQVDKSSKSINVLLSLEETYGDIAPVRLNDNKITAFISITRGCDNMCTFCVVPFTRGRERSRNPQTIIDEAIDLDKKGYKEITLLGQNVDSFLWYGGGPKKHFKKLTNKEKKESVNFHQLLEKVAVAVPNIRIRFSTSHPKDITNEVLYTIKKYDNICNYIHLPAQSGNSRILEMMNRTYTREWYIERVQKIREIIPNCGLSSDIISGFCSETEEEHQETISLMQECKFNFSYMYKYSERPDTLAAKKYRDDISEAEKSRRLAEIITCQNNLSRTLHKGFEGSIHKVLIEGTSKKSDSDYYGRNEQNITVVFPRENAQVGEIVAVKIIKSSSATLIGRLV